MRPFGVVVESVRSLFAGCGLTLHFVRLFPRLGNTRGLVKVGEYPYFGHMRLRVSNLLEQRGMTAYALYQKSDGRISLSAAYRLAADKWRCLSRDVLDALCDVFGCEPGDLLERDKGRRRGR